MVQQTMTSKQIITNKILEEVQSISINKSWKPSIHLGQLLWAILDIKHYISNPIPSKPSLLKLAITLVTIDQRMVVI
jgi:hypothetical protein